MKIAKVEAELLKLPLPRPMQSGSSSGKKGGPVTDIYMGMTRITTESGIMGIGYGWTLLGGARAIKSFIEHDYAPLLIGENALDNERLWTKLNRRLQTVGRAGAAMEAQAAVDMALWDIKGKAANLPLYKLLGGTRECAPVYGSDGGWLYMSVKEMLAVFDEYMNQNMMGVKFKIGHADPKVDIARVRQVRKALGDDVWIAVDANQKWDYPTALWVGRELEQLGVAWFEEPLWCDDIPGHARLARDLDIPIAMGETLASRYEFNAYIREDAADILQPDICRVGGITEMLKIVTLGQVAGKPIAPHHMMESTIHVACGVMESGPIEYMPWVSAAFSEDVIIRDGLMYPPQKPGLGLEISDDTIAKYRI
ncbi:mandelate racemase/muconate lactonizing enzyme family protein [bacterium]|nr:mandelate racemase/muconate lactonizing enzyme family protein [bacterium]